MISLLARLGSPDIVGQYALGVAVSVPILMLVPLNRRRQRRTSDATDIRVLSLVFSLLGVAAVGFLEHSTQDRLVVLLVFMAQTVEWVADIYPGKRSSWSPAVHGILSVGVLGIIVAATGRTAAGLLSVLIVRLLALFFYDFRRRPLQALPEDCETMSDCFAANVPCYFIAHMLGFHSLGIFAALASMTPFARTLLTILGRAATPELAKLYQDGDLPGFSRRSAQLAFSGLIPGLCAIIMAILAGPWVLGLLFGKEYAANAALLLALSAVAGGGLVASLMNCILGAGRRFHEQLPLEIAAVAATSLACVVLMPRVGILGAAFACGCGYLVQITGQAWVLRSIVRRPRPVLMRLLKDPVIP